MPSNLGKIKNRLTTYNFKFLLGSEYIIFIKWLTSCQVRKIRHYFFLSYASCFEAKSTILSKSFLSTSAFSMILCSASSSGKSL